MAKRKTLQPLRKPQKKEGNTRALQITAAAVGGLLILLILLIVFVNN
jgi:hypothetical protein